MNDVAGAAAEDGVELIFARDGEALVAARLVAREAVAKIPAPGTLADVAGERAEVADLGRGDGFSGLGEDGVIAADAWVAAEGVQGDLAADVETAARSRPSLILAFQGAEIDQDVGTRDAVLDEAEGVRAA